MRLTKNLTHKIIHEIENHKKIHKKVSQKIETHNNNTPKTQQNNTHKMRLAKMRPTQIIYKNETFKNNAKKSTKMFYKINSQKLAIEVIHKSIFCQIFHKMVH